METPEDPECLLNLIAEESERPEGPQRTEKVKSDLDAIEQRSRVFVNYAKIGLLVVIAILGVWLKFEIDGREAIRNDALIKSHESQLKTELSKPWLEEALRILRNRTSTESETPSPLLDWAVDVFADYSPTEVDDSLKLTLKEGGLQFDRLIKGVSSMRLPVEFSTESKPGFHLLKSGQNEIEFPIPTELIENQIVDLWIETSVSKEEKTKLFKTLDIFERSMRRNADFERKFVLRYELQESGANIASFRLLVAASVVVDQAPIFERQISKKESGHPDYAFGIGFPSFPPDMTAPFNLGAPENQETWNGFETGEKKYFDRDWDAAMENPHTWLIDSMVIWEDKDQEVVKNVSYRK